MNYSLVHYFRNFPLRYYVAGGLLSRDEPSVLFFLSSDSASVLVIRRRCPVTYEDRIGEIADHPPIPGLPRALATITATFAAKLLARNRLHGVPKLAHVPNVATENK